MPPSVFAQMLQLRFQQQMHPCVGQDGAVSDCLLLQASGRQNACRVVDCGDGFTRPTKNPLPARCQSNRRQQSLPFCITKLRFAGPILLLAVERHHQLAAGNRRHERRGPVAQHQLRTAEFIFRFYHVASASISVTCVRKQTRWNCRKPPRRLAGEIVGALVQANHMA